MSWASCIIVTIAFFLPPFELGEQLYRFFDTQNIVIYLGMIEFGIPGALGVTVVIITSWLAIWLIGSLLLKFAFMGFVDQQLGQLVDISRPVLVIRLLFVVCVCNSSGGGEWH